MDIQHFYLERGEGEPLLLLHGNGEDSSYFLSQLDYFSKRYRVIAIDTRGHGKTPRGTEPFTLEQFARDLFSFLDEHAISSAHILGFSDGANIAMIFALLFPERVKSLVLCGGNLNPKGLKLSVLIPIQIEYSFARRAKEKSPKAKQKAELLSLMVNEPNLTKEDLAKISAPTLVVCGTRDMISRSHTKEIAAAIPCATLAVLKGDHFLSFKRPAAFNARVEEFLNSLEE